MATEFQDFRDNLQKELKENREIREVRQEFLGENLGEKANPESRKEKAQLKAKKTLNKIQKAKENVASASTIAKRFGISNKNSKVLSKGTTKLANAFSSPISSKIAKSSSFKKGFTEDSNLNWRNAEFLHEKQRELDRRRAVTENNKLSANTAQLLKNILATQNKGYRDNLRMQRILREKKILSASSNLLKTPSLFGADSNTFKPLERDEFDILSARNVFAENRQNNIMDSRGRPTLLQAENIFARNEDSINVLDADQDNNLFSQANSQRNRLRFF